MWLENFFLLLTISINIFLEILISTFLHGLKNASCFEKVNNEDGGTLSCVAPSISIFIIRCLAVVSLVGATVFLYFAAFVQIFQKTYSFHKLMMKGV